METQRRSRCYLEMAARRRRRRELLRDATSETGRPGAAGQTGRKERCSDSESEQSAQRDPTNHAGSKPGDKVESARSQERAISTPVIDADSTSWAEAPRAARLARTLWLLLNPRSWHGFLALRFSRSLELTSEGDATRTFAWRTGARTISTRSARLSRTTRLCPPRRFATGACSRRLGAIELFPRQCKTRSVNSC